MPAPKRKPPGRPIAWADADLVRLSQVDEDDIEEAEAFWTANAPARYRGLLNAQPEEDDSLLPELAVVGAAAFLWRESERRYLYAVSHRVIGPEVVRAVFYEVEGAGRGAMFNLAQDLIDGKLTIAEWQREMARQIKLVHTTAAAGAQGGWAQMSQADWGFTGNLLKRQYAFLDNFAAEIADGSQPLNGRLVRRAGMYGDSGRGSYEAMRGRLHRDAGFTEEMRMLGPADHCEPGPGTPGCVELADQWAPIGTLPRIGEATCRSNCYCHFIYRNPNGEISEEI